MFYKIYMTCYTYYRLVWGGYMEYKVRKIADEDNKKYDKYIMEFEDGSFCYYYEAYNNKFVNVVELVFYKDCVNWFENNKIYVYFMNYDINYIRNVLNGFNTEFSNLKFIFNMLHVDDKKYVLKIVDGFDIDYDIVYKGDILDKKKDNVVVNNQYKDYNLNDNIFIKRDDEEVSSDILKEYANYNGYNERLIDKNVGSIVNFKNRVTKDND